MKGRNMKQNPFDISFGKNPNQSITRSVQRNEIMDVFTADIITQQLFLITGIRGAGKTVLMNSVANTLEKEDNWIVIRLNPDRDLLDTMGAKLCSDRECVRIFKSAKLSLHFPGIGAEISGEMPAGDIESELERMLKSLKKAGKRILVTIDEVTNSPQLRTFASAYQIMIGQELPVFLLMTGLYDNVRQLQDEKHMTFLYKAPRIPLGPLNIGAITTKYQKVFSVTADRAREMALTTKGYSFAFQALGYAAWKHDLDREMYMEEFRQLLEEYVYDKIWSEMSPKDRRIANGLAHCPDGKISRINEYLGLKTDEINQYRKRLINKGIINGDDHGYLRFTLPLFDEYVLEHDYV